MLDLNLTELKEIFRKRDIPAFRAQQIFGWVYKKGILDFDKMNNLPLELRQELKKGFSLADVELKDKQKSKDGAEKFLFQLKDKQLIESVLIPTKTRNTVCLSSQVGCKFKCTFCASGLFGFKRNLTCAEIVSQILFIKQTQSQINNIVFMGMGEPLDNYDNVLKAVRIINSKEGLDIGARKITISTNGLIPEIKRLAGEGLQFELSISLHAADDKTRSALMPVNKKYPLDKLIAVCREYIKKTNRQITFEYILIKGINSGIKSAENLVELLRGMNCKVNIISYNPVREFKFSAPSAAQISLFQEILKRGKIHSTLRRSRGQDINAACGELRFLYNDLGNG